MKNYMDRLTLFCMAQPYASACLIVTLAACWAFTLLGWMVS